MLDPYARRDTAPWRRFLDLLVLFDCIWVASASALVDVMSKSLMRPPDANADVPSPTHSFDAGAASGYFASQASLMGRHAHGMAGFDHERAFIELEVPAGHRIEAAYAVGRRSDAANLTELLRDRERSSPRRPLAEFARKGSFST